MLLAISAPLVVAALNQLFGYVPGVGLVETISEMRVLEAPVTEKRDEITLTLNQVLAYQDHVEPSYTVEGIPAEKRFNPEIDAGNEGMFCLGADSYPSMLLPDGATIEADPMSLGGKWLKDQSGYYVGHSFSTPVPKNTSNARFVLKCLSEMKRGETPEDWSLPFNLVSGQEGKAVGAPIINVETSDLSKATDKGITLTLNQVVEEEDGYVMYVTMGWDQTNNSRLATAPMSFTVTDASGHASTARSLAVVAPEAGPGTVGFTLTATATERRGFWRTKATLSCTTINHTEAQAATMARGQAWITLGGGPADRDQLVIKTGGATTGEWALSVTDTAGQNYAATPIGSTLVASVPGGGRYSVAASVTARATTASGKDSVEHRLRATVSVTSLRNAMAAALGSPPRSNLDAPSSLDVAASTVAEPMQATLAGYQPCAAKPGCAKCSSESMTRS